jgi:plasmid stabilization system protein ParE
VSEITRRPSANRDLRDICRCLARQAGVRVADRSFDQAEAIFAHLARHRHAI